MVSYGRTVFINCPFDAQFAPLLEAAVFCCVYLGFEPLLTSLNMDGGESRLDKIVEQIRSAQFSIHDLSRCKAEAHGEYFRMNMPFEYGIDYSLRKHGEPRHTKKKFLIFEEDQYDLKKALSDAAGQDVEFHSGQFDLVIPKVRNFLKNEAGARAPGATLIENRYVTFQGWLVEKKIADGHSEEEALNLPTKGRISEMKIWMKLGQPKLFVRQ